MTYHTFLFAVKASHMCVVTVMVSIEADNSVFSGLHMVNDFEASSKAKSLTLPTIGMISTTQAMRANHDLIRIYVSDETRKYIGLAWHPSSPGYCSTVRLIQAHSRRFSGNYGNAKFLPCVQSLNVDTVHWIRHRSSQ